MGAVFVTGATGTVGAAVVTHLAARGTEVIAAVRDSDAAPSLPPGVGPRAFAFGADPEAIGASLEGADRLFLMRPPAIEDVQTHLFPVIDAALDRGIRQIVFLSLQGVQANRRTPHHAVEQYLRERHAPFTFLRPNFFMQNLSATYGDEIRRTGHIVVPAGRSRTAFIDARDIGRVAATVFTEPGHIGKAYTLSGEQSLSYRNVAAIMSDVLGREIVYARPSEREYLDKLVAEGWPRDYIDVQKMIYRVVRLNVSAFPNRSIRRLTGDPATTFRQFVEDYRHVWNQPTSSGR
ncbi:SDR family oxidoreductase [Microbacterium protaetiae]|uniref:SDR family oxidoreductase n=1 Tax=Microbacterium protaetiae TaxID=2509458 RepID=A0A4P6EA92_9MICO|nr:SDR family oxidoreductase [Microbacterium protaetiae]QAY58975.1 SDR family oxidoreductase [Microbacterium protaetiae]